MGGGREKALLIRWIIFSYRGCYARVVMYTCTMFQITNMKTPMGMKKIALMPEPA